MGELKVDFGAVESAVASLRNAHSMITSELRNLENAARALSGEWSGDAQRAYQSAHARLSVSMAELTAVLAGANALLQDWNEGIQRVERTIAVGWPG